MLKNFFVTFGSGDCRAFTGLTPAFDIFSNNIGVPIAPPAINEVAAGLGIYQFQYDVEKQSYAPPFDRRININLLASYTLGKNRDWEVSARFNYGSAFPFTQTQGFYESLSPTSSGVGTNINQQNGTLGLLYASDINGGRLSAYHRMDISVKKKFKLSKYSNLETGFSATNVYNRKNIFYVDRKDNVKIYQLPVFPSLNVNWNF